MMNASMLPICAVAINTGNKSITLSEIADPKAGISAAANLVEYQFMHNDITFNFTKDGAGTYTKCNAIVTNNQQVITNWTAADFTTYSLGYANIGAFHTAIATFQNQ